EQDRRRPTVALHPRRDQVTLRAQIDRQHDEPLVSELSVEPLDRRGQLPRAVRSGTVPEVEEGGPAARVGERDALAVERFERERRRELVAERGALERREAVGVSIVV